MSIADPNEKTLIMAKRIPGMGPSVPAIDWSGDRHINLADPQDPQDGATKAFVDGVAMKAVVRLTTAQLKTAFTAALPLLAAPGAGKAIVLDRATFRFNWATTQYAAGGASSIFYTGGSTNLMGATLPATFFTGPTAAVTSDTTIAAPVSAITVPQNTGLTLAMASANLTTGDSTIDVILHYRIISV